MLPIFASILAVSASGETVQGLDVDITFFTPSTVRVYKVPQGSQYNHNSLSIIKKPEAVNVSKTVSNGKTIYKTSKLQVELDNTTGGILFRNENGDVLLRDKDYGTQFTPINDAGTASYNVRQAFLLEPNEIVYGMGQQQTGRLSQRNQKLYLRNSNTNICIPFMHSEKGYGLYWDNYSPTTFLDNRQETSFDSEVGDCADYYFIYGGNAEGVVAGVRDLTGSAPMYPLWTLGLWQCRERYKSPDELCYVLDRYRKERIPLDGIIQDWQYWGCDSNWNSMAFENPRYINKIGDPQFMKFLPNGEDPNADYGVPRIKSPKEMVDYVHDNNAHIMISVWASFGPWTDMYQKMEKINALLRFETWPPQSGAQPYDPFNPEARKIYWDRLNENIFSLGMDAWWLDSTEPDHLNIKDSDFDTPTYLGSFRRVHNAFPLMTNKGVYENQRAASDAKRVFLLTRSSSFGQQHYGSHSWSGDVTSTWNNFRNQVTAGINYSLCGIPYWNTDLGGFFAWEYNNTVDNVAYHELHTRWYEWGAFQPIMRSHNSSPVAVEIYQFGKPGDWAYDAIKKYTRLRYRLLPYLYSTTWDVTSNDGSIIRPFVMDFAHDRKAKEQPLEYMFGKSFLVRPVTDSLYTYQDESRNGHIKDMSAIGKTEVYLPSGAKWYDFWTNELLDGGQTVNRDTPIDIMPVYVRAGSIVPWGPDVQYAAEKNWDNLEIRVYPGQDAEFVLYEDENDNYNYEKGICSTIKFSWDDATNTLTIADREGEFPGMLKSRKFRIVKVNDKSGVGDSPMKGGKTVRYNGNSVKLKI
ncbi:MAG: DUF5110 domain-containing protein [Muribaculum sp.]|nr:DUF5110 domain-containing protein [Muribaculum sp.]